jgi:ABC transport system ATP-binding/permease protein
MRAAPPHQPDTEVPCVELHSGRHAEGQSIRLRLDRPQVIGRDASADVAVDAPSLQPRHARIAPSPDGPLLEPLSGSAVTVNGVPATAAVALQDGDWLVLGGTAFQVRIAASGTSRPACPTQSPPDLVTFGRLADCTIQIDSPLVSREHARLEKTGGTWVIADRGSTNGTFVNGQRLSRPHTLKAGDRIDIATFGFLFTGEEVRPLDTAADGRVGVEVDQLCKQVRDRTSGELRYLLKDISFVIEPGEFVAIFGTSGSGKSTLLDALSGRRAASSGQVRYNGTELYSAFDRFRSAIGYVPQQDIVHRKITVSRALEYTARLRLPPDTARDEIARHVERVLGQVGLTEKAQLAVDTPEPLSGGQLKRVSLGVELVANPNILFLDEVTSGLDAGTDKRMMHLFAELAKRYGKTVICVTHTLENIDACHLIVLLHRGRLVYFGPPGEACAYFGIPRLSDVYELLESRPAEAWASQFESSSIHARFVADRLQPAHATTTPVATATPANRTRGFDFRQAATLLMRYVDLIRADTRNLLILFAQAPLIGLIIGLVFGIDSTSDVERATNYTQISFILMLSAIWFGCLNSAREVVKELPIYLRERSINLGLGAYLFSKIVPLAVLALIQCVLLLLVVESLADLPGSSLERLGTLFLAALGATLMGLTISTLVNSNDKAVATVPILLIPQVILSGAVVSLGAATELAAKFSMISYWGFDAMKSTLGDATLGLTGPMGGRLIRLSADLPVALCAMAGLAVAFLLAAIIGLKLKDRRA